MSKRPKSESSAQQVVHVVGLSRRSIASLVDLLVLCPVIIGCLSLTAMTANLDKGLWRSLIFRPEIFLDLLLSGNPTLLGLLSLATLLAMVYQVIFISLTGATLGKRLVQARVINPYGAPPELWRTALRSVTMLLSIAPLGIGIAWIGVDRHKRGLHDWISGTYVVDTSPRLLSSHAH